MDILRVLLNTSHWLQRREGIGRRTLGCRGSSFSFPRCNLACRDLFLFKNRSVSVDNLVRTMRYRKWICAREDQHDNLR